MAKAYLLVRAVVADAADRPGFDRWYEAEHLPDAVARFGAERGWRCWSRTDPSVHYAFSTSSPRSTGRVRSRPRRSSGGWWPSSTAPGARA